MSDWSLLTEDTKDIQLISKVSSTLSLLWAKFHVLCDKVAVPTYFFPPSLKYLQDSLSDTASCQMADCRDAMRNAVLMKLSDPHSTILPISLETQKRHLYR